jgi:hypothetical protein
VAAAGLVVAFVLARVSHPGKAATPASSASSGTAVQTQTPQLLTPSGSEVPQVQTSTS